MQCTGHDAEVLQVVEPGFFKGDKGRCLTNQTTYFAHTFFFFFPFGVESHKFVLEVTRKETYQKER